MSHTSDSVYVDKFYEMDPEFDELLPTGADLRDGMVVLIEDSMLRVDLDGADRSKYELDRAKEMNRWCVVSNITITPRFTGGGMFGDGPMREGSPLVSFVAEYPDGTKRKRSLDSSFAWLVKKGTEAPAVSA